MMLPPNLTTTVSPRNRWMYGSASISTAAFSITFCIITG